MWEHCGCCAPCELCTDVTAWDSSLAVAVEGPEPPQCCGPKSAEKPLSASGEWARRHDCQGHGPLLPRSFQPLGMAVAGGKRLSIFLPFPLPEPSCLPSAGITSPREAVWKQGQALAFIILLSRASPFAQNRSCSLPRSCLLFEPAPTGLMLAVLPSHCRPARFAAPEGNGV